MRKPFLLFCFFTAAAPAIAQQATDTFHIYFDLNVPELNLKAKHQVDQLLYTDQITPGKDVMIVGYADYLGTEGYNKTLSESRANNVANYLETYNIERKNIKLCIGKGEVDRKGISGADGFPADRRVDIVVESRKKKIKYPAQTVTARPTEPVKPEGPAMDLSHYEPGEAFVLKNLYFLPERHAIRDQSMSVLQSLFNTLAANPTLKIQIEGHVCCIKNYPDAMDIDNGEPQLSVNRAKAVYTYLVQRGIDAKRLKYLGYGHSKPLVADERTEEDANRNRRVEIRILEK